MRYYVLVSVMVSVVLIAFAVAVFGLADSALHENGLLPGNYIESKPSTSECVAVGSWGVGRPVCRITDEKAGVVCYAMVDAIDCLPIKDTSLK